MSKIYKGHQSLEILTDILSKVDNNGMYPQHKGDAGYHKEGPNTWVAWDNSNGCCWVEEFKRKKDAIQYATEGITQ